MQLLVVGATGGLGRAVLDSALARGHDVTALVRRPDTAGLPADVHAITGDVLDPASMEPAVRGRDAVICALGTPSPREATTLLERGTTNLVKVMTESDDSGLDWVLVRPPTFVGLRPRRPARVIREGERGRVGLVVRAALAELLVHAAGTVEYSHQAIAVGR